MSISVFNDDIVFGSVIQTLQTRLKMNRIEQLQSFMSTAGDCVHLIITNDPSTEILTALQNAAVQMTRGGSVTVKIFEEHLGVEEYTALASKSTWLLIFRPKLGTKKKFE